MYTHRTGKDAYLDRNLEAKAPPSMKYVIATIIATETVVCCVDICELRVNDKERWGSYDSISECFHVVLNFSLVACPIAEFRVGVTVRLGCPFLCAALCKFFERILRVLPLKSNESYQTAIRDLSGVSFVNTPQQD